MKKMKNTNVIKKLVNYGLITLIGFSLFTGCQVQPYYLQDDCTCYDVTFNMRLPQDSNGYYHLTLSRTNWQTLHRVEGVVNDNDGNMVESFWVEWDSNLYWHLGDTLGYIVTQYLNAEATYVSVDTSYMVGFDGMEVPTSNKISYSNMYGNVNNMIAPVESMIGDTLTLTAYWYDGQRTFNIVLD